MNLPMLLEAVRHARESLGLYLNGAPDTELAEAVKFLEPVSEHRWERASLADGLSFAVEKVEGQIRNVIRERESNANKPVLSKDPVAAINERQRLERAYGQLEGVTSMGQHLRNVLGPRVTLKVG